MLKLMMCVAGNEARYNWAVLALGASAFAAVGVLAVLTLRA